MEDKKQKLNPENEENIEAAIKQAHMIAPEQEEKKRIKATRPEWLKLLDERQRKEVEFAAIYAKQFAHGTDGHNRLLLISRLADLVDEFFAG